MLPLGDRPVTPLAALVLQWLPLVSEEGTKTDELRYFTRRVKMSIREPRRWGRRQGGGREAEILKKEKE